MRILDPTGRRRRTGVSIFCRSGLAQRDPAEWFAALARIDRDAARDGRFVAASIVLAGADGAEAIAAQARRAGLRVFELNVGAPHASEATPGAIAQETDPARLGELVARVRAATEGMALWVKLTGLSANLPPLALAASQAGADAVCMMGRFMAMVPDLDTFAPVLGTSGAYGGGWALPIVCRFLALSRGRWGRGFRCSAPTACGQRRRCCAHGAGGRFGGGGAVGGDARGLRRPDADDHRTRCAARERGRGVRDLVGRAADALQPYTAQEPRPGRWRDLAIQA